MPRYVYGKQTPVPSVANMTVDEAKNVLASAGFRGVVGKAESSDSVEQGKVSSSSPSAGTQASAGAAVTLHTSSGPAAQPSPGPTPPAGGQLTVPEVRRMPFSQARDALARAGFQVAAVWQPTQFQSCLVYGENPNPQSQAPGGSVVTIVVDGAEGKCP
jgi:serine/threonine-protein kinase